MFSLPFFKNSKPTEPYNPGFYNLWVGTRNGGKAVHVVLFFVHVLLGIPPCFGDAIN